MTCSPPLVGGEHVTTIHQNCSKASSTVITRVSTGHALSPENYRIRLSGLAVDSIDRRPETRSIGFSLISISLLKTCLVASLSRPLPAACLTQPSVSTQLVWVGPKSFNSVLDFLVVATHASTTAEWDTSFNSVLDFLVVATRVDRPFNHAGNSFQFRLGFSGRRD